MCENVPSNQKFKKHKFKQGGGPSKQEDKVKHLRCLGDEEAGILENQKSKCKNL